VTLDAYAAWAATVGAPHVPTVEEIALGLVSEVGEVTGVLTRRLRDGAWRPDQLADELGDVAYYWARLCAVTGLAPSALLARSRAHVEWRQAGRPAGGPAPAAAATTLAEYTAWVAGASRPAPATRPDHAALGDAGLALAGDAGEVIECLRRLLRNGEREREILAGELGDVWRHWTRACLAAGLEPVDLLARSRAKIEARLAAAGAGDPA
jgi:NTP pyrophosphatase (non-canonical NTP hydrolase)